MQLIFPPDGTPPSLSLLLVLLFFTAKFSLSSFAYTAITLNFLSLNVSVFLPSPATTSSLFILFPLGNFFTPLGNAYLSRNVFLALANNRLNVAFCKSSTTTPLGGKFVIPAAPPVVITGTLCLTQYAMIAALSCSLSVQSTTYSTFRPSPQPTRGFKISSAFSLFTKSSTQFTFASLFRSNILFFIAKAFDSPTVDSIAIVCLLIFVTQMKSKSIKVNSPIDVRAKASAHQEPMPPIPIITTCVFSSFETFAWPYSFSVPTNA